MQGTPDQQTQNVNSDDEGTWRVVTRRSREVSRKPVPQGSAVQNLYQILSTPDAEADKENEVGKSKDQVPPEDPGTIDLT